MEKKEGTSRGRKGTVEATEQQVIDGSATK